MDARICAKINGDYDPSRRRCSIKHIDEVRGQGKIPDGWYRVPANDGLGWSHFTNGKNDFILEGTGEDGKSIELWVGDNKSGYNEVVSLHRNPYKAEESAEKFIFKNPEGWK